ncbi:hypothetical protein H9P43_007191 [Blastocladiella emersonii ATCC 22665]|nr:hypothetical protein H9P43_007191 [Blastocladiella emersonii ATCC 22665]
MPDTNMYDMLGPGLVSPSHTAALEAPPRSPAAPAPMTAAALLGHSSSSPPSSPTSPATSVALGPHESYTLSDFDAPGRQPLWLSRRVEDFADVVAAHEAAAGPDNARDEADRIRGPDDLYWTRADKVALCRLCPPEPGFWRKLRCSQFWFHLQYHHDVCAVTGRPYRAPLKYRHTEVRTREVRPPGYVPTAGSGNRLVREGWCADCNDWVALDSVRNGPMKAAEILWFKHAKDCQKGTGGA